MNKNNILILVIVLLTIVLFVYGYFIFFKLNKEQFQSPSSSSSNPQQTNQTQSQSSDNSENTNIKENIKNMENAIHKCKFYPWGPTLESCKKNCTSNQRIGLWDLNGKECTEEVCSEICGLCSYEPACQWIASWTNLEKEKMFKNSKEDTVISKLVPRQLNITGMSYPNSELVIPDSSVNIKVSWTNYGDSKAFMIHFYNMKENENMIKVENIVDGTVEEYNLEGLNPNSKYSVIIYAMNEYGISKGSNIIIVET